MEQATSSYRFDESILTLEGDEIVRPIYTLPLHEFRLEKYCQEKGMACYLPLRKVWKMMNRSYKGREYQYQQELLRPMFTSYIFVKMTSEQRAELFQSKSVARILPIADTPHFLNEIKMIHQIELIAQNEKLEFNTGIKEGDKFLIESGPWQGIYGWLKKKDKRFKWTVEIECVNGLIEGTLDPSQIKMSPCC